MKEISKSFKKAHNLLEKEPLLLYKLVAASTANWAVEELRETKSNEYKESLKAELYFWLFNQYFKIDYSRKELDRLALQQIQKIEDKNYLEIKQLRLKET
ncbi:MAG: hypothetical protein RBS76_02765 [Acholeplasmatales bacterium]|jgi:flavin-dependent dehydrogenase|nr:hypothetical protein [Acholeplasmataceae bacterium]MDY0115406.1 hypothetical protein [Acholeplasmatales bacterium]MCK9234497.1 hypothetical protein [Acholeplasmataceae bacterium]MCK9289085.1 hypothetical protein [Acholeplasmataceae bacterium]MCK9427386.1 hypothetical protein [Acholeplasmataceae bacterium]